MLVFPSMHFINVGKQFVRIIFKKSCVIACCYINFLQSCFTKFLRKIKFEIFYKLLSQIIVKPPPPPPPPPPSFPKKTKF